MATKTYTLWYRGRESISPSPSDKLIGFPFHPTYMNDEVVANIPPYSIISKAVVALEVKRDGSSLSLYHTDSRWGIRNSSNTILSTFDAQKNVITTEYKEFSYDFTSYFKSGTSDAGRCRNRSALPFRYVPFWT